jgi:hypothetical protein
MGHDHVRIGYSVPGWCQAGGLRSGSVSDFWLSSRAAVGIVARERFDQPSALFILQTIYSGSDEVFSKNADLDRKV